MREARESVKGRGIGLCQTTERFVDTRLGASYLCLRLLRCLCRRALRRARFVHARLCRYHSLSCGLKLGSGCVCRCLCLDQPLLRNLVFGVQLPVTLDIGIRACHIRLRCDDLRLSLSQICLCG